jgi:hypothetical protein
MPNSVVDSRGWVQNISIWNRFLVGLLVGVLMAGSIGLALVNGLKTTEQPLPEAIPHTSECVKSTIPVISPGPVTIERYAAVWELCSRERFGEYLLTDYLIRREKFVRQELDERVTMWLVVSITLAGVVLAAIQLFMSYRLATAGLSDFAKDSELLVEKAKVSFKSSVTGLVILAISLLFFIVYVRWIYTTQDISLAGRPQAPLAGQQHTGPMVNQSGENTPTRAAPPEIPPASPGAALPELRPAPPGAAPPEIRQVPN